MHKMRWDMRIIASGLLLALTVTACRPNSEPTEPGGKSISPALSPLYETDSYQELVEENWTARASDPPSIDFSVFAEALLANRGPTEDLEDVYAAVFAIASQHAFAQSDTLDGRYFLVAAALSSWWHPPGTPTPNTEWVSRRPGLISSASESGFSRLDYASRFNAEVYTLDPHDALDLLATSGSDAFLPALP